jgi:hypothetical protein
MIETALLILTVGTLCIACFFIGAKVGQKVSRGETIEAPHPIKAIEEHKEKQKVQREQDRIDVIMQNIEAYDGTGYGQKDVPKG